MAVFEYINKVTNKKIDDSSLILASNGGTIESLGGAALRYTPGELINAKMINAEGGYQESSMPSIPGVADASPYDSTVPEYKQQLVHCRRYTFGIDSVKAVSSSPNNNNGFISKEIDLHQCSYIELSAKTGGEGNIEYSIIDGTQETPILPVEQTIVVKEKLFFGLGTRFEPDKTRPITIYKDGKETSIPFEQLGSLNADGAYSISYTPVKSSHIYYPQNQNIKIKVVQRCENGTPATINDLVILRHGGGNIWSM